MFCLIQAWINSWVNNCEVGELRRYLAHYDVIVMNILVPRPEIPRTLRQYHGCWCPSSLCCQTISRPQCWLCAMMMSSNGNIFHVTGLLCEEFTGHWWIPLTKASDVELWCFLCSWTNGWENNQDTSDLRCDRAHYDVTVMQCGSSCHPWEGMSTNCDMSVFEWTMMWNANRYLCLLLWKFHHLNDI